MLEETILREDEGFGLGTAGCFGPPCVSSSVSSKSTGCRKSFDTAGAGLGLLCAGPFGTVTVGAGLGSLAICTLGTAGGSPVICCLGAALGSCAA